MKAIISEAIVVAMMLYVFLVVAVLGLTVRVIMFIDDLVQVVRRIAEK